MLANSHLELCFQLQAEDPIPLAVSMVCQPGERIALLGPSGSGKTTLLRSLAGLHTQARGQIYSGNTCWLDSEKGIRLAPEKRQLGLVFQSYALFPHLTALGNLMIPVQHLGRQQRKQRALHWLARVGLQGLEERKPSELSGGQRQRVALARALIAHPRALLLDEPFSAVDQATRHKLRRELALLSNEIAAPLILVTHDLEEAMQLADRICLLHHGQVLQIAPPDELMRRPASPTVARLLGLQNLFEGRILSNQPASGLHLDWQGQLLTCPYQASFQAGQQVSWMAPPQSVILHRPGQTAPSTTENRFKARLEEVVTLGPHASVRLRPQHAPQWPLSFYIPHHFIQSQQLATGMEVNLSLIASELHLFN